jgi:hypothetical protein
MRLRRGVWHPLGFGAFPILFLLKQNLWGLRFAEMVVPLAVTLAAIAFAQLVVGRFTRRPRKVGICLSAVTLLFFSYGHVWRVASGETGRIGSFDADVVLGGAWVLAAGAVIASTIRTRRPLIDLNRLLNVFAIAMVATVAFPLGLELLQNRAAATTRDPAAVQLSSAVRKPARNPDIYYLVFDRYAGAKSLDELFGYDNADLLDHLQKKGFSIADDAKANYQSTTPSLAASLNMKYLDWIADEFHGKSRSSVPMYEAIDRHEVGRFLQARGYRYVHVGSRWDITRSSPIADVTIRNDNTSEFTRVFFGSTALLPAMRHGVLGPEETDRPESARRITLRQLDEIEQARRFAGPTFVFAHLGLPHPPYVFDRNGGPIDEQPKTVAGKARAYLQQLEYANTRITELVDKLLDAPEDRQPVVILQADEGPYPSFGWLAPKPWWKTSDANLRTKFRILTALRMPGVKDTGVYPELSPVNIFRVVFNAYFDAGLPMLPDESYVPTDKDTPYVWTRITDRLGDPAIVGPPRYPPRLSVVPLVRRVA